MRSSNNISFFKILRNLISTLSLLLDKIFKNPYLKFLFVFLISLTILFGMFITPDGFSYMEAANNISRGNGFVVNCNLGSAIGWQPFYSYLMIPFFYLLGYTTLSLIIYNILLFVIAFYVYDRLLSNAIKTLHPFIKFISIVIALFPFYTILLSESLLLILLGLYVIVIFFYKGNTVLKYFYLIILIFSIFSTKNSALLIIVPIHLSQIVFRRKNLLLNNLNHLVSLFVILLIFATTKIIFGTTESHTFALGKGTYPLTTSAKNPY